MTIYLAGGMSGLSFKDSNGWRAVVTMALESHGCNTGRLIIINPNDYYNFQEKTYETEREVREFDLYKLRHSDLVIVNFNDPKSIGTAQELAVAAEHRIPVVGLNRDGVDLHPWLQECVNRMFVSMDDLIQYVNDFYLS